MSLEFKKPRNILSISISLALIGCGGGGAGSASTPPNVSKPPIEEPRPPVEEPKPPVDEPKPPVDEPKPPVDEPKPPVDEPKPPIEEPKPPVDEPKPPVDEPKPPVDEPKPPVDEPKPPVDEPKPPIEEPKPPVDESKPPVDEPKPPVDEPKPPVDEPKPPIDEPKPPVDEPKPPVDEPKPPVDEPKPPVTQPINVLNPELGPRKYNADNYKVSEPNTSHNIVKVGVVDSGLRQNEMLKHAVKEVYQIIDRDYNDNLPLEITRLTKDLDANPNADLSDQDIGGTFHGTIVASIIAAKSNGDYKYQNAREGDAKDIVELYGARTSDGNGGFGYTTTAFEAMLFLNKEHGVKLFNGSYGARDVDPYYHRVYAEYTKQLIAGGALQIYSSGNDGLDSPSSQSLIPTYDPLAEKGILVATGLNQDKTGLYYDSSTGQGANACGAAARWCVASDYVTSGIWSDFRNSLVSFYGTSGAAPLITALAAQVWSKYPWMTADQVRQTILTTADFMEDGSGDKLFNATYGWGYYNEVDALKGPEKFLQIFGEKFEAMVNTGTAIFSNDISGDAGLVKSGFGALVLTGDNSYTGETVVERGELRVNGSIDSHTTTKNSGVLSGAGIVASVTNNGRVSTAKGRLTVDGDYKQGANGVLSYDLWNYLTVNGKAELDGKLQVTASSKSMVVDGGHVVLTAVDGITGDFKTKESGSSFFEVTRTEKLDEAYIVEIKSVDAAKAGTLSSGLSAPAGELTNQIIKKANEQKITGLNTKLTDYVANIQQTNNAEMAQSILNSNSGAMFAETPSVLLKNDTMVNAQIAQRNYQVAKNGKSGAWIAHGQVDTKASAKGWDSVESEIDSLTAGADVAIDGRGLIGAYVTNYDEQSKYTLSNGNSEINLTTLGVYGKLDLNKNVYLSANANYGFGDAEFNRLATDGVNSENSLANADLDKFGVYGEIGYQRLINQFNLSPYLALSHNTVSMDAIKESSEFGVSVNDVTAKETKAHLGLRAEFKATPQLSLVGYGEYAYAIDRDLPMVNLSSNLLNGVSVDYRAPSFDKDYFLYGVGVNFATSDNKWNLFGDLNGNAVNSADQQVQVGLKYNF